MNQKEFQDWAEFKDEDGPIFVVVKTENCPKCAALMANAQIWGPLASKKDSIVYSNDNLVLKQILKNNGCTGDVPIVLFRWQDDDEKSHVKAIIPDEFFENFVQAVSDNDHDYFDFS